MSQATFSQRLLTWFDHHGRHNLPWQIDRNPYRVWLSEIMLQQTQVATVIPYFLRFVERFPNVEALAGAHPDEILHLWSGLGYYARARNLHRAAQHIVSHYDGVFPNTVEELSALPGIGQSTAGAICALAFDVPAPILDGNVKRVLTRYHALDGWPDAGPVKKALWEIAKQNTPQQRAGDYTQAIMDLGATVCTRSKPVCPSCPFKTDCKALSRNEIHRYPAKKSRASLPTRIIRMLIIRTCKGEVLLQKRPPQGVWGGLWSLPEESMDSNPSSACERLTGQWPKSCTDWAPLRHTFSHFHLDIHPVVIDIVAPNDESCDSEQQLWYKSGELEIGMAAPVGRLLESISGLQCSER